MTIGRIIFVSDPRLSVEHEQTQESSDWRLVIDSVRASDEGTYQSQVNTKEDQLNHHNIHLHVKSKYTFSDQSTDRRCRKLKCHQEESSLRWLKEIVITR